MVVGYQLGAADSKSHMFRSGSSVSKCSGCGYRLDFFAHNPMYHLRGDRADLYFTYDGQTIASKAFREFCRTEGYRGVRFLKFDADDLHFHLLIDNVVPFDVARRRTRFENLCCACGNYESVVGATPPYLLVREPLPDGIYRSDVLFASGDEKGPLRFVAPETKRKMETAGLKGIHFKPAEGAAE